MTVDLIAGDGFTIHTADGAVHRDLSRVYVPVRYDGGTKLTGRLNGGPVETVNFLYRRDTYDGDLLVPAPGAKLALPAGTHVIYASDGGATVEIDGVAHPLADRHALRLDREAAFALVAGRVLLATLTSRGTPRPASGRSD